MQHLDPSDRMQAYRLTPACAASWHAESKMTMNSRDILRPIVRNLPTSTIIGNLSGDSSAKILAGRRLQRPDRTSSQAQVSANRRIDAIPAPCCQELSVADASMRVRVSISMVMVVNVRLPPDPAGRASRTWLRRWAWGSVPPMIQNRFQNRW